MHGQAKDPRGAIFADWKIFLLIAGRDKNTFKGALVFIPRAEENLKTLLIHPAPETTSLEGHPQVFQF